MINLQKSDEQVPPIEETPIAAGYDIVLVIGQSNASGTNTDYEPDGRDARDQRIMTYPKTGENAGNIVLAREPLAPIGGHPPGGMGPGGPFASLLLETLPPDRRILIVPAAMGGTGFRRHGTYPGVWKSGLRLAGVPNLLADAIAHLRSALTRAGSGSKVVAVLWQQGESDGGRPEPDYADDMDELISTLRIEVPETKETPFLAGGLPRERLEAYPDHWGVEAALRNLGARVHNASYVDPPPLGHINDKNTHLTAEGQRILGANYFKVWSALMS